MANFDGNEGTMISLSSGADLTSSYRGDIGSSGQNKGYFFGKNKLNQILSQADCMGIRVYFGEDAAGVLTLVLVGAKANKDDMTTGFILDMGAPCPNQCSTNNSLNS